MFYHVLIQTSETGEIYEFDHQDLDGIKKSLIVPYLSNEEFQFDGYFIEPSKVKRLLVSNTQIASENCLKDAYNRLGDGIIMTIRRHRCVFFDSRYANDITRHVLKEVKKELEEMSKIANTNDVNQTEISVIKETKTVFLGYSYSQIDDEFVSGFKELLEDKGFEVIDGKADGFGSISEAIIEKISISDVVVIVMTKRDKKENGKFTTSAWLLEEKGAALALKKAVGMFVEEEVDSADIGGMQGDNQRFHFTRNNFLKVAMNFLKILAKETNSYKC